MSTEMVDSQMPILFLTTSFSSPLLKGFFNMFIYSRPSYLRLREAGIPMGRALLAACFESDVADYIEHTTHSPTSAAPKSTKGEMANPTRGFLLSLQSSQFLASVHETLVLEREGTARLSEDFEPLKTADVS